MVKLIFRDVSSSLPQRQVQVRVYRYTVHVLIADITLPCNDFVVLRCVKNCLRIIIIIIIIIIYTLGSKDPEG